MEEKDTIFVQGQSYKQRLLTIIRGGGSAEEIRELLAEYHELDLADAFEELSAAERENLRGILGSEAMSEIVAYLDDAGEYLSEIESAEAAEIIRQMDADDAHEALNELDEETRDEILRQIKDPEIREDIALLDSYGDGEFGSRMSTNFIAVKRTQTIKEAMRTLVAEAPDRDNIYTLFALREDGRFYGAIDLKDLIVARSDVALESLIRTAFPFVYDKDRIADKVERLREYSEDMIPVLSSEDHTLLGVITAKDVAELVDEELGDDYAKLAAMTAEEEPHESVFSSMRKRVPWLIALLFMGLAVSAVVGLFEGVVAALPMIVSFQSLILGMAGNVGTQSLAVTVRTLGNERERRLGQQCLTVLRELRVALIGGLVLGLIAFSVVCLYLLAFTSHGAAFILTTAACVGLAMCFAMAISGLTGAAIPIALQRLGIDPAVASGPLITTVNDLFAVVSYYGLAYLLLSP